MLRSLSALTVLASFVAAASFAAIGMTTACSSSSSSGGSSSGGSCDTGGADGGNCTPGQTPAYVSCLTGSALQSPSVSFAKDVAPTFNMSCAVVASCHQPPANAGVASLVLGTPDGGVPAATVLAGIVGKPAVEDPNMEIVKAGDPEHSYLMHKLDGDQCQYANDCNATHTATYAGCGLQMPYNSGVLDQATRDNIRRWIGQGAQNN